MSEARSSQGSGSGLRVRQALELLAALQAPKEQQNERSALVLLTLLDLTPRRSWARAADPLLGITEIMGRIQAVFGRRYAPNTRESIRRSTIHQFVDLGLVVGNPDDPQRPVNSPANRYRVTPQFLKLARCFSSREWKPSLAVFLAATPSLKRLSAKQRSHAMIPVLLPDGTRIRLTAGGQNELVRKIVDGFCPRFTPGGTVIYLGDTGAKHLHFRAEELARLGITLDQHGKMPDLIVHLPDRKWLVLIEAVTSHGPIGQKRQNELKALFASADAGLVFVTAFLTRRAMNKYLGEIAWETEAWIASEPDHLIHFNGERFLGPYA
ncbi:MAG: BsuBI/PstI family type II restriction endonuclease [Gemmatimonadales bacterium]|nr:BsuBI/PstI family type II restriction endonuclease [Gemmatimonadales bacterium]